jgi:hypothetical protein
MIKLLPFTAAAASALLGCAAVPAEPTGPAGACPIAGSRDWRAWVNAMPGPDRPRLIVIGEVTVPTGGWQLSLELGATREIDPPVQEVVLRAVPPSGAATQAIVTREVRGDFLALPRYGAVVVRCGSEVIAEISPVETAH